MLIFCQSFVKANDQLRRWFEDDDALERVVNGECVHQPSIYEHHFLGSSSSRCIHDVTIGVQYLSCLLVGGFYYHVERKALYNLYV